MKKNNNKKRYLKNKSDKKSGKLLVAEKKQKNKEIYFCKVYFIFYFILHRNFGGYHYVNLTFCAFPIALGKLKTKKYIYILAQRILFHLF